LTIIIVIMKRREPFRLVYAPEVIEHLQAIDRKYYSLIRTSIEDQLRFEPNVETQNRKPLKRPSIIGGQWELRFGPDNRFRVFYEVDEGTSKVHILAIGVKERDRLYIAGREVEL
jgi:mRNA-degrading endonuclease RelE of RelBE toxin-antitoxin system